MLGLLRLVIIRRSGEGVSSLLEVRHRSSEERKQGGGEREVSSRSSFTSTRRIFRNRKIFTSQLLLDGT